MLACTKGGGVIAGFYGIIATYSGYDYPLFEHFLALPSFLHCSTKNIFIYPFNVLGSCVSLVPRMAYSRASFYMLFQLDSAAETTASEGWYLDSCKVPNYPLLWHDVSFYITHSWVCLSGILDIREGGTHAVPICCFSVRYCYSWS